MAVYGRRWGFWKSVQGSLTEKAALECRPEGTRVQLGRLQTERQVHRLRGARMRAAWEGCGDGAVGRGLVCAGHQSSYPHKLPTRRSHRHKAPAASSWLYAISTESFSSHIALPPPPAPHLSPHLILSPESLLFALPSFRPSLGAQTASCSLRAAVESGPGQFWVPKTPTLKGGLGFSDAISLRLSN